MTSTTRDQGEFRILVPYDGSEQSSRALHVAQHIPADVIEVLRVEQDDLMILPGSIPVETEGDYQVIREELDAAVAPLRDAGRNVETTIRVGDAAEEIINAARNCNLVIMTTRGRGAAGRMLFGSTADRVSRHSGTPTLLIRSTVGTEISNPSRVVVALDGSDLAEQALPIAIRLAGIIDAPVHLVRAIDVDNIRAVIKEQRSATAGPYTGETYEDARKVAEERASSYLEAIAEPIRGQGLTVNTELLEGTPSFVLLWNTNEQDLVVMTSHGRHGFRRWYLGSVAEKLVREGKAPVLLVPTRGTADA
jgi:nucleotide-binding universal stress UspA family protein